MKITSLLCSLFIGINMCTAGPRTQTGDSLGLPGDNLDLYGVLDLFKKSESPEEFEKKLNSSDTKLNNLDLNGDGEIDYIRVIDRHENNLHALVLQIPINEDESQDVAVIEIEKNTDGSAHLQIVGDEELYGKNYILEPVDEAKAASSATPANTQQRSNVNDQSSVSMAAPPVIVNVYAWPSVRYIYAPAYVPWVSPWRWRYYPPYWRPWRPVYWSVYHPYWHPYRGYYRRWDTYRIVRAHDMYYGHRVVSRTVYERRAAPRSAPAPRMQQQQRRSPEQRGAQRQRIQQRQSKPTTPRSNPQPRQNTPRGGGKPSGGTTQPRR